MAKATFDYDSAPRGRAMFPASYMTAEIETAGEKTSDQGKFFAAEARIVKPHADGTQEYDGQPVFLNFYVGTEDDPDAEDPKTWSKDNDDVKSRIAVQDMIQLLVAAGLTKGEGRGVHPAELFEELEGKKVMIHFGSRVAQKGARKGETFQTMKFYAIGEREPQLIGSNGDVAPRRARAAAVEPEPEADEDRPRRGRR